MDVVTTSLEALIQRATNPRNEKPDIAAIEAFCVVLAKESKGVQVAGKLLATHVQSSVEKEALQALELLDTCMRRCGRTFHTEIGKFRFLNVLIKLVSPKYLGDKTAAPVRLKILELLRAWTVDYPRESKIKETYKMLRKQGIVKDSPPADTPDLTIKSTRAKNPIFEDEEKTKLLQELLRSKDPFDLKLANKLIKSMVKDVSTEDVRKNMHTVDEKRVQMNCQRDMELQSVHVNVKLLSEMLDSYDSAKSSSEDVELMKELYEACERLKPTVTRLACESHDNDETIGEVLAANDELSQVLEKYGSVMKAGRAVPRRSTDDEQASASLLDLSSPLDTPRTDFTSLDKKSSELLGTNVAKSDMEILGDVFGSLGNTTLDTSLLASDVTQVFPDSSIMQPVSIVPVSKTKAPAEVQSPAVKMDSKARALEDLDQLSESLLKQSLSRVTTGLVKNNFGSISKSTICPKTGPKPYPPPLVAPILVDSGLTNDTSLLAGNDTSSSSVSAANGLGDSDRASDDKDRMCDFADLLNNDDDAMLDASISPLQIADDDTRGNSKSCPLSSSTEDEIKPLTDIRVTIDNIKPGTIPALSVIEEKNGISVVLHFAEGSPREDVTVIVVTTMSKNSKALSNYLFQAVVPKGCKCRLEPPSGTVLPSHNPFLPPSAITQIMLIANPRKEPVSLKFMLSYEMENETFTEMGEVDKLPTAG